MESNPTEQMRAEFEREIILHDLHRMYPLERNEDLSENIYGKYELTQTRNAFRLFLMGAESAEATRAEQIKQLQDRIAELERVKLPPESEAVIEMAEAICDEAERQGDIDEIPFRDAKILMRAAYRKLKQMMG